MIVVYPERLIPASVNVITLQDNKDNYFYVYLDVYNQALLLKNQYRDNLKALKLHAGFSHDYEAVDYLFEILPEPINYLSIMLNLLEYSPDANEITYCCGALSMILDTISVIKYLAVPPEIRKEVTLSIRIQEEYEIKLSRFMEQAISYSKFLNQSRHLLQSPIQSANSIQQSKQMEAQLQTVPQSLEKQKDTYISPINLEVDENGALVVPKELNGVTVQIQDEDDDFFDNLFAEFDKKNENKDDKEENDIGKVRKGMIQKEDKQVMNEIFDSITEMVL